MRISRFPAAAKNLLTIILVFVLLFNSTAAYAQMGRQGTVGSSNTNSFRSTTSPNNSSPFGRSGTVGSSSGGGGGSTTRSPSSFPNYTPTRTVSPPITSRNNWTTSRDAGRNGGVGSSRTTAPAAPMIVSVAPPSTQEDEDGNTWYYHEDDGEYHDTPQGGSFDYNNDGELSDVELDDLRFLGWFCFAILVIIVVGAVIHHYNERNRYRRGRW